jgi:putative FmdB family regulatory protein
MPFYEYQCPSCHHVAEVMQKISDAPLKKCPACGKAGIRRLISAPVFRLKGSGWYETDFKSDKEGKRNLAGRDAEETKAATEVKAEAKGEASGDKPAQSKAPEKAKSEAGPEPARSAASAEAGASRSRAKTAARKPAARQRVASRPVGRKSASRRRAR